MVRPIAPNTEVLFSVSNEQSVNRSLRGRIVKQIGIDSNVLVATIA